jgi:hypothetical protein
VSGGQSITSGQGFVTAARRNGQGAFVLAGSLAGLAVTVALAGAAVACAAGTITPNSDGVVPLLGSAVSVQQQALEGTATQAITGSATTPGQGSLAAPRITPTGLSGQASPSAAGTVQPSGFNSSAHLSGEEAVFASGAVTSGEVLVSGLASGSAQGVPAVTQSLPLLGLQCASAQGAATPDQLADDTYVASQSGSAAAAFGVELAGSAASAELGSVGTSPDVDQAITGQASASAAGTVAFDRSFALAGEAIGTAQHPFGAPGYAALTGAQTDSIAGTIHLTNDRDYALTGAEASVLGGGTSASALAFPQGAELASGQGVLGDQTVALSGQEIVSQIGDLFDSFTLAGDDDEPAGGGSSARARKRTAEDDEDVLTAIIERSNMQAIQVIIGLVASGEL